MIIYLKGKSYKELNTEEGEMKEKIENNDTSWFPLQRSISLGIIY